MATEFPVSLIVTVALAVAAVSAGFGAIIGNGGWASAPFAMIVVVTSVGAALTYLQAPVWVVPISQAAAGLLLMLWLYVDSAPYGVVPTPGALSALRAVFHSGLDDITKYGPPVPPTTGIVALTTLGVGVVTMCTYVAAVCLRLPILAGAPLIGLYVIPAVTLTDGTPWWSFALFAAAMLALVVVDTRDRVRGWGAIVARSPDQARLGSASLFGPAWRLGAVAVVTAIVLPPLAPGLTTPFLGGHGSNSAPVGAPAQDQSISLDPFVSLRRNLTQGEEREVFEYRGPPTYLRSTIADIFDGERFVPHGFSVGGSIQLSTADLTPGALTASVRRTTQDYHFQSIALADKFLPVPAPLLSATVDTADRLEWRWDLGSEVAFSVTENTGDQQWSARALQVSPTLDQLRAYSPAVTEERERQRQQFLSNLPPLVVSQARAVTEGYITQYDQALAIQWWLRTQFRYSLDVKGDPDANQLTAFLTDRVGYCQQFAATMALMARVLGMQSRVAVGFSSGRARGDGWTEVSNRDAHAWPEIFFGGVGWVRFEPTPRSATDGGTLAIPPYGARGNLDTALRESPAPTASTNPARRAAEQQAAADAAQAEANATRRTVGLGVIMALLLIGCVPLVTRRLRRRQRLRRTDEAEAAWRELRDTVVDVRQPWLSADTPRQAGRRLVERERWSDEVAAAVGRLAEDVERTRYAPTRPPPRDRAADIATVRQALMAAVDPSGRLAIVLWPRSVLNRR